MMDLDEAHFVSESGYKQILNEIKLIEDELPALQNEKFNNEQKIEENEKICLTHEEELKNLLSNNSILRNELEEILVQKNKLNEKHNNVEKEVQVNSERLSIIQHKVHNK